MSKKRFGMPDTINAAAKDIIEMVEEKQDNRILASDVLIRKINLDPNNPRRLKVSLDELKAGKVKKSDPDFKRKSKELEGILELSKSIQRDGLINAITIVETTERGAYTQTYQVVAGERRFLATVLTGAKVIPCRVFNKKPNKLDLQIVQWAENENRQDIFAYEKLMNISDIISSYEETNNEKISGKKLSSLLSCSEPMASYHLGILRNNALLEIIEQGAITSLKKARDFISCKTKEEIIEKLNLNGKAPTAVKDTSKRTSGRKRTSINFGNTKNTGVPKVIAESILSQPRFSKYSQDFKQTDWSCLNDSTNAIKKLMKILEKECEVV